MMEAMINSPELGARDSAPGPKPREESVRQTGVAVVECKVIDCFGLCRHDSSSARRLRPARSTTLTSTAISYRCRLPRPKGILRVGPLGGGICHPSRFAVAPLNLKLARFSWAA